MSIRSCQLRPRLGDVKHNLDLALSEIEKNTDDIIVFSELFLTGYPPTDDLLFNELADDISHAIDALIKKSASTPALIVIGTPFFDGHHWRNAALAIANGEIIHQHYKVCLPNYDVFNDARYFVPGEKVTCFDWNGQSIALLICEDIWANVKKTHYRLDPVLELKKTTVSKVIHLAASPFEIDKLNQRKQQLKRLATETGAEVVSVNQIGGYSDILFDGQSMAMNAKGELTSLLPPFTALSVSLNDASYVDQKDNKWDILLDAMTFGLREYMNQTGFSSVLVGVSGGIDSALVAAVAVHALGPNKVHLVTLPTQFNSEGTKSDAIEMADRLGAKLTTLPIESQRQIMEDALSDGVGAQALNGIAKQNIQARLRGVVLMALSNQTGALLLTTGNKSELAMGYATLYGDMCGGINLIGDCFKTDVFALAEHINQNTNWIPDTIISRPPSAELAPNQRDEDSLPPYDRLDQILDQRIMKGYSLNKILELNDKEDVGLVLKRLSENEFKRFQSPPILKLSSKSFGRGWQFPLVR